MTGGFWQEEPPTRRASQARRRTNRKMPITGFLLVQRSLQGASHNGVGGGSLLAPALSRPSSPASPSPARRRPSLNNGEELRDDPLTRLLRFTSGGTGAYFRSLMTVQIDPGSH